jgi:murein DD-endopeptidase MepM/ murein hydrolase activator NlpD
MTSGFGMRRHPILGYTRMHAGIDFGAAYGSPIFAVADGVVGFAGRHGGHGNYVRLEHAGGLGTGYAHMSRIAVAPGVRVHAGQVIGYVGSTGLSTGPHLHFEAYRGAQTINPAGITVTARPQIDGSQRDAFQARLKSLLAVQPGAALGSIGSTTPDAALAGREIDRLAPAKSS